MDRSGASALTGWRTRSTSAPEQPRFYSVAEVARMFGMSSMTLYRAIAASEFPAVRIRGRLIVPAKAIEEMVEASFEHNGLVDAADFVSERAV
ncbi:excisionase family DNA binding protein [Halopolyspora algeriensis]|uniref:Excisionase family DNA binding protein n=2 Tax=Halopolyspora algeriensis TaxID=1500506 RepID=A0A368VTI8_9ACTN|nr:excisionase family DNA binding protein [Halopolyspora algeriensis]TQM53147.1 excisionase family DNA binding protein [Halopolyspora algeriensis]